MLYGVKLGVSAGEAGTDTLAAYGLFLGADVVIPKPEVKSNYIDIPGANGTIDASESPQGFPVFNDIEIEFNMYSKKTDLELRYIRSQLAMSYHGKRVGVSFPDGDGYYYVGRLHIGDVDGFNTGKIPCRLVASPYKLKPDITTVIRNDLTTSNKNITLTNIGRAVSPRVITAQKTLLTVNGTQYVYNAYDRIWAEEKKGGWVIPAGGGLTEAGAGGIFGSITVAAKIDGSSETGGHYIEFQYQEAIL